MITVTVSFKPNGFSAEVIAQVVKLMAVLENSAIPESNLDPIESPVEAEVKATKPRKSRVYTDEQKAAFRARMIAGRKAKEDAKAEESKPIRTVKIVEAKKSTKAEIVPTKSKSIKAPMPRTGQKVMASPAAQ